MIDCARQGNGQTTERRATMTPRLNPYKAALEAMKALVARARGKSEERPYLLDQSPLYGERGRAAVAWTEAVTLVSKAEVPVAISFRSVHPMHWTGVS